MNDRLTEYTGSYKFKNVNVVLGEKNEVTLTTMFKLDTAAYKLAKLENIEEELGINLITLFRAFKNGIWVRHQTSTNFICLKGGKLEFIKGEDLELCYDSYYTEYNDNDAYIPCNEVNYNKQQLCLEGPCYYGEHEYTVAINRYGKTWALTKEELEDKQYV